MSIVSEKVDQALELLLEIPTLKRPKQVEEAIQLLLSLLRCPTPELKEIRLKTMNIHEPERRPSSKLVQVEFGVAEDTLDDSIIPLKSATSSTTLASPFDDPEEELLPIKKPFASRKPTTSQTLRKRITTKKFVHNPTSQMLFSAHDTNDSDGIDAKEFKSLVYSMGYFLSDQEASLAVASIDSNQDGEISFQDFIKWWEADSRFAKLQLNQEQTCRLQEAVDYFTFFDKDQVGYLDENTFREMYQNLKGWGAFFGPEVSMEDVMRDIKGNSKSNHVSFNDYIGWLIRKNAIAPIQL